ncbi:MAG: ribosome recycling factor [Bdellovibrionales bacterium]|nr:ribosome recycling factor [Bdellovibrionales bacterium]
MVQATLKDLQDKMEKAIGVFQGELTRIRTGRASSAILEMIKVDYYGTMTPVNQMASINVPESRLIVIQPWDQSALPLIEKAIQKSDLGIVPQNDGKVIKLPIPTLTEERRKMLTKQVSKLAEDCRIAVRNIRRHGMDELKKIEKDKQASEDELKTTQEKIQTMTDTFIKKVDQIVEKKSKELLEV